MGNKINWKEEIVKLVYVKRILADLDKRHLYPHHFPKVAATIDQLRDCERVLGFRLRDGHEQFLLHANGWNGLMLTTDLFGTDDFKGSKRYNAAQALLNSYEEHVFKSMGVRREEIFPIAASHLDLDIFVMARQNYRPLSTVFWLAGHEVERFSSFTAFYLSMVEHNKILVLEERETETGSRT
jgi:hypothetical protein